MARELSDAALGRIRNQFDDTYFLDQVRIGNMTPEDASFLFDIPLEEGIMTAPETVEALGNILGALDSTVLGSLDDFVQAENILAEELYGNVMGDYMAITDSIEDMADRIDALLRNDIAFDLGAIDTSLDTITQAVLGVPTAQVQAIDNLNEDLSDRIFGWMGDQSDTILGVLGREADDILGELSPVLDLVQSTTEDVVEKTSNFASALRETIPEIGEAVGSAVEGVGEAVTTGFTTALGGVVEFMGLGFLKPFLEQLGDVDISLVSEIFGSPPREDLVGTEMSAQLRGHWAEHLLIMVPFLGNVGQVIFAGTYDITKQLSAGRYKSGLLGPADYSAGLMRHDVEPQDVESKFYRTGLDDADIDLIRKLQMARPDIATLVRWQARGFITPDQYFVLASEIGWAPERASQFTDEYYGPPPIGDLIRMVVRDTFEPDVVEQGQLSDGFETFPVEVAEQQGLTPFWSEKYWQAHWELPSLQQGFEMLHRGEINRDALLALFKAADLAPGYWEPMEAISYRPFTRVDVRRMNAFGILGPDEVKRSYLDIGYNEEKAQALTDFTLAYNDQTKKVEKTRERDLSKSDIIGMYNDGVIDAVATRDYLIKLGYSDAEAEVLIDREDIQEMRRERKADISNIIDQAKIKSLTFEEAQDRLAALDLTRTETNKALADLARVSQTRTRTPSKSDLDDWLALGLITSGDYAEELRTLGFADRYVDLYVEATTAEEESDLLAQEEKAARRREPRAVSKGNLDSLFQAEIIDLAGYTEGLTTLGYRERDISNLLEQQTLKLEERQRDELERLERGEDAALVERLPSRSLLGKLYLKGLITIEAYQDGLTLLGFSPENVELLSKLITAKGEESASESA